MKFVAIDDERLALRRIVKYISELYPDASVEGFDKPSELLEYAKHYTFDVAFLDIQMYEFTGVELAKRLKKYNPNLNIIFVTGYDEYTSDAMDMHASGYILKPVTKVKILKEMNDLRYPLEIEHKKFMKVQCFGNFECFNNDGEVITFDRKKAKELFAYLVYRKGASCSTKELSGVLFEDSEYTDNVQVYFQVIVSSLIQTFKKLGLEGIIKRSYGNMSIDTKLIDCDWYNVDVNDDLTLKDYSGEFMAQYSWAEFVNAYLHNIVMKDK